MEKNMKKNIYIYVYVQLSHFAAQQKLTQYCKSTMLQLKNFYFIIICILIFTDKYIERPLKMFEVLVFFFFFY